MLEKQKAKIRMHPPFAVLFRFSTKTARQKIWKPFHSLLSARTHLKAVDAVPRLECDTHARFGYNGVKVASKSVTMRGASQSGRRETAVEPAPSALAVTGEMDYGVDDGAGRDANQMR